LLAPFDRIVIATGAAYRFGLGPVAMALLDLGAGRWPLLRQFLSMPAFRDWFYYRARNPTGQALKGLARPGQEVVVIGDALTAGKSRPAIASAFDAALTR
jgi:dimethylglycine catabolism A